MGWNTEEKGEQYETIGKRMLITSERLTSRIPYSIREKPIEIDRGLFANTSYTQRDTTLVL